MNGRAALNAAPTRAVRWTAFWVGSALVVGAGIAVVVGRSSGLAFLGGYATELALSLDNLAVIALIFASLDIPHPMRSRVLGWGIMGAIVMRGIFVFVGAAALAHFAWVTYVFGGIVLVSGIRLAFRHQQRHASSCDERSPLFRFFQRTFRFTNRYDGDRFFTIENGRRVGTPLLFALLLIETTDVLFAVDSIPAIFGITHNPVIVYTSNLFAVAGLRSLYVLIARALARLRYLHYVLAAILVAIGLKMILAPR